MSFAAAVVLGGSLLGAQNVRAADFAPPMLTLSFDSPAIGTVNGWSTLTMTIGNPNVTELTGVGFTVTLSDGILFANPDSVNTDCSNWPSVGGSQLTLSGVTLPALWGCTVTADVLGVGGGTQRADSSGLTSTEGGAGATTPAQLYVAGPAVTTAVFGATAIEFGGTTSLTFTLSNPNGPAKLNAVQPNALGEYFGMLSGLGFTDTLPAGLIVATPNGLTGSCGGGTITATAGSGTIVLADATLLDAESCTFSVNVTGVAAGTQRNSTGTVFANEGLGDPGTGTVVVGDAPVDPTPTPTATATPTATPTATASAAATAAVTPPASTTAGDGRNEGSPATPPLILLAGWFLAAGCALSLARARR